MRKEKARWRRRGNSRGKKDRKGQEIGEWIEKKEGKRERERDNKVSKLTCFWRRGSESVS